MRTTLLCLAFAAGTCIHAQSSGFGAGIILGEPTGISLKGWLSADRAVDGAVAWSLLEGGYFSVHADYLFHNMDLIHLKKGKMPLYYGPGLRMRTWNSGRYRDRHHYDGGTGMSLGVRFPVGLAYLPAKGPVDLFLELVPGLELIPATWFDISGAIGARYWF